MHLDGLQLTDYRAFAAADVAFPATGIVLVVGPNNAGKSAFLSALDVVSQLKPGASSTRVGSDHAEIAATFRTRNDERTQLVGESRYAEDWLRTTAFTTLTFRFRQIDPDRMGIIAIETTDEHGDARTIGVATSLSATSGSFRWTDLNALVASPRDATLWEMGHGSSQSGNIAAEYLPSQAGTALAWPAQLLYEWRRGVYHFEALRPGTQYEVASRGATRLDPTGVNLAQALLHLKSNDDPAWPKIVDIMQDVVPDVGILATPVTEDRVQVVFNDPYLRVQQNVKNLGTGVEQLLMTVYVGVRQPAGAVIIVEEPETNLHPAAQRALLRYIREWSQERLFILATHSTVFLDEGVGQGSAVLIGRSAGIATARTITHETQDVLLSLGVRLSDVLSAEKIVLVEGATDVDVLRAWFPELARPTGIAVTSMGGGDQAWNVDLLPMVLEAADSLDRELLVLRDRDELPDSVVEKLEEGGVVVVLKRRELENYLLDVPAISDVLDRQAEEMPDRRGAMEHDDIEALLRERADALRDQIILKRVVARAPNIRLVSRADVAKICEKGASLDRLLNVVEARLTSRDEVLADLRSKWGEESDDLARRWDDQWRSLAPGADLLDAVWSAHGGSFDKGRDGALIALSMDKPPPDLRELLDRALAPASS